MSRRIQRDPDDTSPTPFPVILGEWWDARRAELASMSRSALEIALGNRSLPIPRDCDPEARLDRMLWMRLRLAFAEEADFMVEHNEPVPESLVRRTEKMDAAPGKLDPWQTNIFYGKAE